MLTSVVKGESKHSAGVPTPDHGTLCFQSVSRGGGQVILGTHFGKSCSRLWSSEFIRSPGKHLHPDLHKGEVSHQAARKVKFRSEEWTED